ncbi:20873_t:CDS:2, partial [Gigaspora margarita]
TSTTGTSTTRTSTTRTSTTRASKAINLVSSDDSETDSLVSSDYDTQEDDNFQNDDNDNRVNLVIKCLLAALAASFKKRNHPAVYFFSFTSYENEQGEDDNEDNNEDDNEIDNEDDNESMTEKKKKIADAIEFVNKVIREKKLSEAKKTPSEVIAEVIGGGPWFAKCIRK